MTRHGPALLTLSVLAIAGWTYGVNYDTRAALDRLDSLRGDIAEEREALQVLRIEWAYLNAPDRLARLVSEQKQALELVALTPDALGHVAAVPYPRGLPVRPVPGPAPEMLVAAAPTMVAPDAPGALALAAPAPAAAGAPGQVGPAATAAMAPGLAGPAQEAGAGAGAIPDPAASEGTTVLAAAEPALGKAEALGGDTGGLSMADAVALALAEAGVIDAKLPPPIVAASASAGMPMPRARPAVWGRQ